MCLSSYQRLNREPGLILPSRWNVRQKAAVALCVLCGQDCVCGSRLPAGCDCDPDVPNADAACAAGLRCVGCKCQVPFYSLY
jgi:hypothetical protein